MQRAVDRGLRVLMLATDAHGGFGGIAQYNRDVLEALSRNDRVADVHVLARIMAHTSFEAPPKVDYDLASSRGLKSFAARCAFHAINTQPDLVYCAHINLLPLAAAVARLLRAPLVLAIYGIDAWERPRGALHRLAASMPQLVISISQITLDRFLAWSGSLVATAVVPNAIAMEKFATGPRNPDLERRYGVSGRKVIMTFGRMSADERYKGFDEVIELLPRLRRTRPDLVYIAAGDGTDRARLEAKARERGIADAVVFTGAVNESEKADLYRLADAYVMPSSGEGFGFVVLEALACGIPVVASTTDGTREAVRGGELGLLVDPSNADDLEKAVLEALSRSKAIPPGLDYFSFANFERRLAGALGTIVAVA
jgi:glycosyltransferase involved in cell wall biosynthesis